METTQVATASQNGVANNKPPTLKGMLDGENIKKRFQEMLGDKAAGFISSIISVVNGNTDLKNADPSSIIAAAAQAASMDLQINPNLGFAYIIPYKITGTDDNGQTVTKVLAQFQMGYKGFIQLAKRSGQYLKINAIEIRKGQLIKMNPLTEDFEFDFTVEGGEVVGYAAYMKEVNGFEKIFYWNTGQVSAHQKRFSKAGTGPWKTDFDQMAKKTLLKGMLSKFGTLSVEMQKAIRIDQGVVQDLDGENVIYADSTDVTNQQALTASNATLENNFTSDKKSSTDTQASSGAPAVTNDNDPLANL